MTIVVDGGSIEIGAAAAPATPPPVVRPATGPTTPVHFALPFRYANGVAVVNEQDSIDDIATCVEAVIRYPKGHRPEQSDFGITDPTFRQAGADLDQLREEVGEWEDRAPALIEREPELLTALIDRVAVTVGGPNG